VIFATLSCGIRFKSELRRNSCTYTTVKFSALGINVYFISLNVGPLSSKSFSYEASNCRRFCGRAFYDKNQQHIFNSWRD